MVQGRKVVKMLKANLLLVNDQIKHCLGDEGERMLPEHRDT
jgi:hypothetical protein